MSTQIHPQLRDTAQTTLQVKQMLVIADDLSGAADCTAGALQAGLSVHVTLGGSSMAVDTCNAQVWSIDADTRRLPVAEAVDVVGKVLRQCSTGGQLIYKKIDSTLRGHVAAELSSMLPRLGMAIIAPAFPDAGRITRQGCQYLDGVALEETEIWRREGLFKKADIPQMLAEAGIRCALIRLESVRSDVTSLREQLEYHAARGVQAVVCDAETDMDLAHIAQASVQLSQPAFWVGSAGLAGQLPAAVGLTGSSAPRDPEVHGPILIAVGSASSISQIQARALARARRIVRLGLSDEMLFIGEEHADWETYRQRLDKALVDGQDVLLILRDTSPENPYPSGALAQALAHLIAPFSGRIGGMISTGGETTRAILSALGSTGLQVLREIERGIPLSCVQGTATIPLITKAGAFGSTQTLVHCYDVLRRIRH